MQLIDCGANRFALKPSSLDMCEGLSHLAMRRETGRRTSETNVYVISIIMIMMVICSVLSWRRCTAQVSSFKILVRVRVRVIFFCLDFFYPSASIVLSTRLKSSNIFHPEIRKPIRIHPIFRSARILGSLSYFDPEKLILRNVIKDVQEMIRSLQLLIRNDISLIPGILFFRRT